MRWGLFAGRVFEVPSGGAVGNAPWVIQVHVSLNVRVEAGAHRGLLFHWAIATGSVIAVFCFMAALVTLLRFFDVKIAKADVSSIIPKIANVLLNLFSLTVEEREAL